MLKIMDCGKVSGFHAIGPWHIAEIPSILPGIGVDSPPGQGVENMGLQHDCYALNELALAC